MTKISLGLDIGTDSVGWAVVDENNQIVKKNGYSLWGVRMFNQSVDASNRRAFRSSRRRIKRRKQRISLLRNIFIDEINNVDPAFFERLDDSFYKFEHKKHLNIYNLFNDSYTDKDFFKEFPTIYHLRKHLVRTKEKADIRFLYLALHNMIKYRGNFLSKGDSFDKSNTEHIKEVFSKLNTLLIDLSYKFEDSSDYFETVEVDDEFLKELEAIMISKIGKTNKKIRLKSLFNVNNKSFIVECLISLLVGSNCNISKLTPIKDMKYEKCDITLECEDLDILINEKRDIVPELEPVFDFIPAIKEITDYYYLIDLLGDNEYLCDAMVQKYEEHQSDLKKLKIFIKKYLPEKYTECFRIHKEKLNNYASYVGMNSVSSKHPDRFSHCSREDFYKYLNSLFDKISNSDAIEEIKYFKNKIDNTDFLLRQNSDQNGSIPMQLNLMEIKQILNNQLKYYPFILEKNGGVTNYDKIVSIFKFTIPYYVGPLTSVDKSDKAWMVRKKDGKIYPWNYDEIIDLDKTSIQFIQRMQRKCTYLKGSDDYCLPKNSIIFSKYNCLSYLNKLSINGTLINYDIKMSIFNNLFLKVKKPTKKMVLEYIQSNFGSNVISTTKLKDLPEVNCDMSSYIKFSEIFGDVDNNLELIEQIIRDIVIFTDKGRLEKRLLEVYGLEKNIVKKIKDLNYKDYSNLSNNFINGIQIFNPSTGELYGTLLEIMEKTNMNLQEVMYHCDYRYCDVIDQYNSDYLSDGLSLEEFLSENVAMSPINHRPLVQAYKIIEEVERILKCKIDKYYIECTRTNEEKKKQSTSRYDHLKTLLHECRKLSLDVDFVELDKQLEDNKEKLRSDKIYLYFTQLGRCMYSMKKINFGDLLSSNNMYDIDHIYPQSLVKDDSFSNKVLVLKEYNNKKQDNLLFEMEGFLHPEAFKFFRVLLDKELITKEKYSRLTKKELNPAELESFVNRQIVATSQAVKGLITTLKLFKKVNSTDIIYSKASVISDARIKFNWPKSRLANNFHHAHDAYLNVVIGKAINDYYIHNHFNGFIDYYRMKTENKTMNPMVILDKNRYAKGKCIWDKENTCKLIEYNLYERFDVKETTRTYSSNELLKKVTINPAGKGTAPVSLTDPRQDISLYGAFTSYSYSKYVIIKVIDRKGMVNYILESIPKAFENDIDRYLLNNGYKNYEILHDNIQTNVVVRFNDLKFAVASRNNDDTYNIKNLHDRYFSKNNIVIIKKLEKYYDNRKFGYDMAIYKDYVIISPKTSSSEGTILTNEELDNIFNELIKLYNKKVYSHSNILAISQYLSSFTIDLSLEKKIFVCYEMLKLLQTNSRQTANLKDVGLSVNSGRLTMSKKLKPKMKLISESPTGYYSKVLFEVPTE